MKVRYFYTGTDGIRYQSGWLKLTQEQVESKYMDLRAKFFTDVVVERTMVVDITQEIESSWEGLNV